MELGTKLKEKTFSTMLGKKQSGYNIPTGNTFLGSGYVTMGAPMGKKIRYIFKSWSVKR